MNIKSSAFFDTTPIPKKYTGEGDDMSPPLEVNDVPHEAKSLVIICDDPDAPRSEPFVHWVLFNMDPKMLELVEGASGSGRIEGAIEGMNDFGKHGYGGPMPPVGHGMHHYRFKVYALDTKLDLSKNATKKDLLVAMKGHILVQSEIVGTYERK